MRPRRLRRGNQVLLLSTGDQLACFNEAAATSPRKRESINAFTYIAPSFNEAAATSPRKRDPRTGHPARFRRFNEAAATSPRKPVSVQPILL